MNVCSSDVIVSNVLEKSAQQQCIAAGNKGRQVHSSKRSTFSQHWLLWCL